ncbi:SRPBCC domain-containing protein [Aestuariimicrobium ganziense]|uniref:SRPBCC domain-containing protein n=1 Tax=Aestuariimicrobium ganziense TaxID=2773677 RepID=UPI00194162BF|nr:SRPBCC domain-containing protein [Aestuariimicrobium ganziense]
MTDATKLTVQRVIDAPADAIFDLLTLPQRHKEFDGSGFIVSDDRTQRIQAVGDVFTMNMSGDHMGGDYQTDNHVIAFVPNQVVGWQTAPAGTEPKGWSWVYTLTAQGPQSTQVELAYDWSKVDDKDILAMMPLVSEAELEDSLNQLASAVA